MSETPTGLKVFGAAMFVAAAAAASFFAISDSSPKPGVVLLFVALVLFSELRAVEIEHLVVSPGWMIVMAAIVVFRPEGAPSGPVIVAMIAGIHWPHFRARAWDLIALNSGIWGLAALAAAASYSAFSPAFVAHFPQALLAPALATIANVLVLVLLLGIGFVIRTRASFVSIVQGFVPMTLQFISFALLGFLLGRLDLALGPAVLLLIIVPIVIAREMLMAFVKVKESHDETVQLLIRALEQKDPYTAGHAERVAVYASYIAEELDFMPARAERLRFAALMHDIGKLVVPNQLLNKPGKLTEEEFARVRVHEGVSVQMLSHIDFLRPIALHAHSDTMRFNPDDLNHPIEPYIIMVADAYDAMTSTRSYRKALPQEVAFAELRDKSGQQFHPACAQALIVAIQKRNEVHGKGHEHESHFEDAPEVGLGSAGLGDLLPDEKSNT